MTEDEKGWEDYIKGGYHPIHIGDSFSDGKYTVVRKLGSLFKAKDDKCV
jgi:serine/threonine-protein kinase SRPK3